MNKRAKLGKSGEERAAVYLDSKGYEILERNYRCHYGEIDIIAMEGSTLCFVEVKTRSNLRHGLPCEAVDRRKMERIRRCAHVYMEQFRGTYRDVRIDILEVLRVDGKYHIRCLYGGRPM